VEHSRAVVWPLAGLGIAAAFSCGRAMKSALQGINSLSGAAVKVEGEPPVRAVEPVKPGRIEWHEPWKCLPLALIIAWIVVFFIVLSPMLTPLHSGFEGKSKPGCHEPGR
jgi:hypothetical protein